MMYIANAEHIDRIYGTQSPVCVDEPEIERLAAEWDMTTDELMTQFHVASQAELEQYGQCISGEGPHHKQGK